MESMDIFEMNLEEEQANTKSNGIAQKAYTEIDDLESRYDDEEDLIQSFAMMSKNVGRVIKRLNRRSNNCVRQHVLVLHRISKIAILRKNKPAEPGSDL